MWVLDAGLLMLNARCIKYNKGHGEVKVDIMFVALLLTIAEPGHLH
jgi:hypothetical protein